MIFLLYLLALTPLVFMSSGILPYISYKLLFIRLLVSIISFWFFIYLLVHQSFQEKIASRLRLLSHKGLFLSICGYFFFFVLAGVLAVDRFSAFFGTVARGEGIVGMIFFFGFFLFALLLFVKKDWLWFFRISLIVSIILFIYQFIQFLGGTDRPSSFIGNPIFVSVYFLFALFAAAIVHTSNQPSNPKINNIWPIIAWVSVVLSLAGILIANSRGVISGLIVGIIATLVYLAGSNLKCRKLSMVILAVFIFLSGIFLFTKDASVWQKVPVLDRFASSLSDNSDPATRSRFNDYKIALRAINPSANGYKKFLIGWGPENFPVAFNTYFDPQNDIVYDPHLSDRAHNQILNTFVTAGLLGLLSYLVIWLFAFMTILRSHAGIFSSNRGMFLRLAMMFFGVAYFVQNLFAFDGLTNYIPFFVFLGFILYMELESDFDKLNGKI